MNKKMNWNDFAESVKAKYPDYKETNNLTLARKLVEKYPEYSDKVDFSGATDSAPAAVQDPSLMESLKAGFAGAPEPAGASLADKAAYLAGETGPVIAGAMIGEAINPLGGGVVGAAGARALQKGIVQGTGMAPVQSPLMIGADVMATGALQKGGELAAPYAAASAKWAGGKLASGARFVGREALSPIISRVSGVTKSALDAVYNDGKNVWKHVGIDPDTLARMGQNVQGLLAGGKETIERSYRSVLGKHHQEVQAAADELIQNEHALRAKAVEAGQELQGHIKALYPKAHEDYRKAIEAILSPDGKYGSDMSAAYPYSVDLKTPLADTIAKTRKAFNYGDPNLPKSERVEQDLYNYFADRISNLKGASVDEAYVLQKHLNNAISKYTNADGSRQPIASALSKLKEGVMKTLDNAIPELRPANQAYAKALDLADRLRHVQSADVAAAQIKSAFKYGGNKQDALMELSAVSPEAAAALRNVVEHMDTAADLATRARDTKSVADILARLKSTYRLGEGKNTLLQLADGNPAIKAMMEDAASPERDYMAISELLTGNNITKQIAATMEHGGNAKDALMRLAETSPALKDAILEAQRAVYGSEFTPWINPKPEINASLGLGARLAGMGVDAAGRTARAIGSVDAAPAIQRGMERSGGAIAAQGLDMVPMDFNTPEEVREAYNKGAITGDQAKAMLTGKWPHLFE